MQSFLFAALASDYFIFHWTFVRLFWSSKSRINKTWQRKDILNSATIYDCDWTARNADVKWCFQKNIFTGSSVWLDCFTKPFTDSFTSVQSHVARSHARIQKFRCTGKSQNKLFLWFVFDGVVFFCCWDFYEFKIKNIYANFCDIFSGVFKEIYN